MKRSHVLAAGILAMVLLAGAAARAQVPQDAAGLRQRLAQIELMVTVDRDFAGAESALAELDAAKLSPELAAVLEEPEMKATRKRIAAAIEAARSDDGRDLVQVVHDAFQSGDDITLTTLGPRAAAAIRASLVNAADPGPLGDVAPGTRLRYLFQLDEPAGWDLVKDNPLVLGEAVLPDLLGAVMDGALHWIRYPNRKPALERPEWLVWIARLLREPAAVSAFGSRTFPGVGALKALAARLASNDAFTPELADALASLLQRSDGYVALDVMQGVDDDWTPSVQPAIERLVADPRVAVRRAAAEMLVNADNSPGLRSRVEDAEAHVRIALVHSLGPRGRTRLVWKDRDAGPVEVNESLKAAQDDEASQLLTRLASDPEPAVREAVVDVLKQLPTPLAADVYRKLAVDPDDQVRRAMVMLDVPDAPLQAEIHATLARDRAAPVVAAIDQRLNASGWDRSAGWLAPVLEARLQNTAASLDSLRNSGRMAASATARKALLQTTLTTGDETPLSLLVSGFVDSRGNLSGNVYAAEADWLQLPADDFRRLLPMLQKLAPNFVTSLANYAVDKSLAPGLAGAGEDLARDAAQPLPYRLAACSLALHEPTTSRLALLHELLADPTLQAGTTSVGENDTLTITYVISAIPAEQRNAAIADVLRTLDLRESLVREIASKYAPEAAGAEDVMRLILDRWLDVGVVGAQKAGAQGWLVTPVIGQLPQHPNLADESLMRRAIHAGTDVAWSAVAAMARLRDPHLLGVLRECLDPTWVGYLDANPGSSPTDLAVTAVDAIHGYMSDEAAQILLDAAANSPRPRVREQSLAAVDAIGRYRDALAAWQRRKSVGETRDAAVQRLVELCSSGTHEVKVEALRALGTIGAVDQLPLVIEALASDDGDVRAAARDALQRLNALPAAPNPGSASPASVEPPRSGG